MPCRYREANREHHAHEHDQPETPPRLRQGGHLFGVDMKIAAVDPVTSGSTRLGAREHRRDTVALIGSAPTTAMARSIDHELGALALERGMDSTSTGARRIPPPLRRELGYDIRVRSLGPASRHLSGHA